MNKYELVYKVTSPDLKSVMEKQFPSTSLRYALNQWTRPLVKNSQIFVFEKLEDAERFQGGAQRIFLALAKNPKKKASVAYLWGDETPFTLNEIKEFWEVPEYFGPLSNWVEHRDDTVLCDELMLLEEILCP